MTEALRTTGFPHEPNDPIRPSTTAVNIAAGPVWMETKWLGWLSGSAALNAYVWETPEGPARYQSVPYAEAGMTWNAIVVGRFRHPVTDAILGWAWRYYR